MMWLFTKCSLGTPARVLHKHASNPNERVDGKKASCDATAPQLAIESSMTRTNCLRPYL